MSNEPNIAERIKQKLQAGLAPVSLAVVDPAIISQSGNVSALVNGLAQFSLSAVGSGLAYQWYQFDGASTYTPLTDGTLASGAVISGSGSSTLAISNVQIADATNLVAIATGNVAKHVYFTFG